MILEDSDSAGRITAFCTSSTVSPGMTVAELLDVLQITKQSLARVLKQLIDTGHIVQMPGPRDRRQRELYPTPKGRDLALELARPQSRRIQVHWSRSGIPSGR